MRPAPRSRAIATASSTSARPAPRRIQAGSTNRSSSSMTSPAATDVAKPATRPSAVATRVRRSSPPRPGSSSASGLASRLIRSPSLDSDARRYTSRSAARSAGTASRITKVTGSSPGAARARARRPCPHTSAAGADEPGGLPACLHPHSHTITPGGVSAASPAPARAAGAQRRPGASPPGRHRPRCGTWAGSGPGRQDLGLLALELLGGDHAPVAQVGQLRQLVRRAGRRARRGFLDVLAELLVLPPLILLRPLLHRAAAGDQVDEHADERDEQHEQEPQRLRPAGQVMAAEDVDEDPDQDPDPDDPQE